MGSLLNVKEGADTHASNRFYAMLSLTIIIWYAMRVTIPGVLLYPLAPAIVDFSAFAFIAVAAVRLLFDTAPRLFPSALLLVVCILMTVIFSTDVRTALIRTALWLGVFVAVGPLIMGSHARMFRNYLWQHSIYVIYAIVVASFFWNELGLPVYGKGVAGITVHCMLLGALAGVSTVLSFHAYRMRSQRSFLYLFICMASFLTCLISGSRAAVLAAVVGCGAIMLFGLRNVVSRFVSVLLLLIISMVFWSAFDIGDLDDANIADASPGVLTPYTLELMQKGASNSRTELWESRRAEFKSSPIVGIGIGAELYGKAEQLGFETIEPGSSYLAILSMTGLLGGLSILLLFTSLAGRMSNWRHAYSNSDYTQVAGVGAFWALHAVAEGWIFAGGSILCLFFWIWVGRLAHFGPKHIESVI